MRMTLLIRFFSGIMFCVKIAYLGLMLLTVWRYSEVLIFFAKIIVFHDAQFRFVKIKFNMHER